MALPQIERKNDAIVLTRDSSHTLSEDHIVNFLSEFFKYNELPSYVNKKTVLMLIRSAIGMKEEKGFIYDFMDSDAKDGDIPRKFNSYDYRIQIGFEETMSRMHKLEVLNTHRTDLMILLNSDDFVLLDEIRSIYNAPVYMADFLCRQIYFYRCRAGNYHLISDEFIDSTDNDLFTLKLPGESNNHFAVSHTACACGSPLPLTGGIYYDKRNLSVFARKDGGNHYIPRHILEESVLSLDKSFLSVKIEDNETLRADIEVFNTSRQKAEETIRSFFRNFEKINNLKTINLSINIIIFGE